MQEPVRVLQLIPGSPTGGTWRFVMNVYRELDKNKVKFDFIAPFAATYEPYKNEISKSCGCVYEWNITGNLVARQIKLFFSLLRFLKNNHYNILHVNTGGVSVQVILLYAAKLAGVPQRIAHSHSAGSTEYKTRRYLLRKICGWLLPFAATHYFACSKIASQWLFPTKLFKSGQVKIINNGIDAQKFVYNAQIRYNCRKFFNLENKFVVGHIGRFAHVKNHGFLIDVFHEIHKQNPESVLLLIGEGELEQALRQKTDKLGLAGAVRFLGVHSDVSPFLQAMDAFVLPSYMEGLGIVAIEAQAAGLKVLASDSLPSEIKITDLLEFMSLHQSPKAWAEKILQWQYTRRNTYDEILEAGFEIRQVVKKLEELYLRGAERHEA